MTRASFCKCPNWGNSLNNWMLTDLSRWRPEWLKVRAIISLVEMCTLSLQPAKIFVLILMDPFDTSHARRIKGKLVSSESQTHSLNLWKSFHEAAGAQHGSIAQWFSKAPPGKPNRCRLRSLQGRRRRCNRWKPTPQKTDFTSADDSVRRFQSPDKKEPRKQKPEVKTDFRPFHRDVRSSIWTRRHPR